MDFIFKFFLIFKNTTTRLDDWKTTNVFSIKKEDLKYNSNFTNGTRPLKNDEFKINKQNKKGKKKQICLNICI